MRKIERQMRAAIAAGKEWRSRNTRVFPIIGGMEVQLHGKTIAKVDGDRVQVDMDTLRKWPTPTTKSRLTALGVDVTTKNHVTYLDGEPIN